MASSTAIYDACVIEPGASKSSGVMAYGAILGGRKMAAILDGSYCSRAIVAGCTVIHDTGMIECRISKSAGYVTD
jgi:hypothetical protein